MLSIAQKMRDPRWFSGPPAIEAEFNATTNEFAEVCKGRRLNTACGCRVECALRDITQCHNLSASGE